MPTARDQPTRRYVAPAVGSPSEHVVSSAEVREAGAHAVGASVALRLDAQLQSGLPFDLSGYTITAPFSADASGSVPPIAAWTVVQETSSVLLSLTDADTVMLAPAPAGATWPWVVWLASATERIMYAHGVLGLIPP